MTTLHCVALNFKENNKRQEIVAKSNTINFIHTDLLDNPVVAMNSQGAVV